MDAKKILERLLETVENTERTGSRVPSIQKICAEFRVSPVDFSDCVYRESGFLPEELLYPCATRFASSRNATLSGPEPKAEGSPESPLSRMP